MSDVYFIFLVDYDEFVPLIIKRFSNLSALKRFCEKVAKKITKREIRAQRIEDGNFKGKVYSYTFYNEELCFHMREWGWNEEKDKNHKERRVALKGAKK